MFLLQTCALTNNHCANFGMFIKYFTALYTCTHHGDVRLAGGETSNEGIVEICYSGSWMLVCDYNWNVNESTVVCRQLTGELDPSKRLLLTRSVA